MANAILALNIFPKWMWITVRESTGTQIRSIFFKFYNPYLFSKDHSYMRKMILSVSM
jgi:hypothetical protein